MSDLQQSAKTFTELISSCKNVTILSHVNPDPDAIGTALGVYAWLKAQGIQVEVVNVTKDIPVYLDFLPFFSKIKRKIDFEDSLIISCDCGSIDRLGFDVSGRDIINIDHHVTNTQFGILNIVDANAVSSSEVAYELLHQIKPISKDTATAFCTALISDTRNFTTSNMHKGIFTIASELVELGADCVYISRQMINRRSLASLRILGIAMDSMELHFNAKIAIMMIHQEDLQRSGAKISDLDGIVDYAKSLATVEIALMFVERQDDVKTSIRSKGVDISGLASYFGGGGHSMAGGFESKEIDIEELSVKVLREIENRRLIK
ncbi:MAG TPA: bifunctional oligoribonuclease/PAP phosphatase NrnA [Sulfurovum sp.]|nr:bifunctional oligoribonuclease/PAP phosphatase NrnA [Sulfurovum sp.]